MIEAATSNHKAGQFSFRVSFLFRPSDGLLERVVLTLISDDVASQLYQRLVTVYDQPETGDEVFKSIPGGESHTAKWKDPNKNNLITYFGIGDFYTIEYAPLSRTGDGF